MRSVALGLTLVLLGLMPRPTRAATPAGRRPVLAVLEYRSGARDMPNIGGRMAQLLKTHASLEVIDLAEARRRMGARLDAEVARCAGEALCTGAIGEQLGADEVLLVGVSQLGDVILALQRIEAKKGEAGARLAESLPRGANPSDQQVLGWLHQLFAPEVFRRYGSIRISSDVAGATVSLNDANKGKTPIKGALRVAAPGSYRLRLDKPGFTPFRAEIDVLPDAVVDVRASLAQRVQPLSWYKRWWVWALVGGTAAAVGAGIAIYYGTRVEEMPLGFIERPAP